MAEKQKIRFLFKTGVLYSIRFTAGLYATYRHFFDDTYYTTMKTKCQRNLTEIFPQFYRSLSEEKRTFPILFTKYLQYLMSKYNRSENDKQ